MSGVGLDRTLCVLRALWVAVMAGFFWAFSFVVMPGLEATEPLAAMTSMQEINRAVRGAVFAVGFFGAALCLAALLRALRRLRQPAALAALLGAAVYVGGVFAVTVGFNVPLNRDLARLDPARAENGPRLAGYLADWSAWNDLRTLAALVAFALFVASLLLRWREEVVRVAPTQR